ncbi:hypothetical protein [Mycobacterium simiae]|uniref:hypothetical protein n=1 Tax=Mycobacterium simiae TaxID=1784 RepID=UPI0005CB699B|nr:hypothetical protein [Mycobacterium simiae]PLV45519.1 hypothetical protein X011_23195 [Mycobacterium tuberculosis variant microti OV254]BBX43439.1 hypothetical protein MSIM_48900 [Mycobacterium simiae]
MAMQRLGLVVVAVLAVAGCSRPDEAVSAQATLTPAAVSPLLSKATWADGVWPFTVPDGVLKCYMQDSMQTFTSNGMEYGLNATARRFGHFADLEDIAPLASPPAYVEINATRWPVKTYAILEAGLVVEDPGSSATASPP